MWHVVRGQEEGKTVVIAARSTYVAELAQLEFHKSKDGEYKPRGKTKPGREKAKLAAYSRILVVRATLVKPWAGRTSVIIANVHLHHCTAKQAPASNKDEKIGGVVSETSCQDSKWTSLPATSIWLCGRSCPFSPKHGESL
jgi:hypothetical protein